MAQLQRTNIGARTLIRLLLIPAIVLSVMIEAKPADAYTAPSPPFNQCPAVGEDTGCALLIYVTPSGQAGVAGDPTQAPFDGIEDTLIGVQNDSSAPLSSIPLSATTAKPLFGFDGDGLCATFPQPAASVRPYRVRGPWRHLHKH